MPTLSVCLIAKNEERNLPRALASVADVADEIIVTDTGSTDATQKIAGQFGVRTAQFPWCDDFAAAHNFCKGLATSDWILMLDADEELLSESRDELLRSLEVEKILAYSLLRQDLADAARPDFFTEMWQTRLYRNLPEIRFIGRCHHHFDPPLEKLAAQRGWELHPSNIRLRHYGYVAQLRPEKLQRAARLLQLELRDRPGQFYYLVELGLTLLLQSDPAGHERLAEAAQMIADGAVQPSSQNAQLAMLLEYIIANRNLPVSFPISQDQARKLVGQYFFNSVPLLWQLAQHEHAAGRFADCARRLEKIIRLGESQSYDRFVSFDPAIMGDAARLNLAVCLVRMGHLDEARKRLQAILNSPTHGRQAADNLKEINRLQKTFRSDR